MRHSVGTLFRARLDVPVTAPVIETPRLLLRPYCMTDARSWLRIEKDPTIASSLHWPHRDAHQALEHLRDRTHHTTVAHVDDFLVLAMELDGAVIGDVSMHLRDAAPDTRGVEAGWLQLADYRGRGYATEAVAALLEFAFDTVHAHWVSAVIDKQNLRSRSLAQRLGFHAEAESAGQVTFLRTDPVVSAGSHSSAAGHTVARSSGRSVGRT